MLTADLVGARRRGDELRLAPTDDLRRARIAALAAALTRRARAEIGNVRDDVEEALRQTAAALEEGGDRGSARRSASWCAMGSASRRPPAATRPSCGASCSRAAAAARRAAAPFDRAAFLEGFRRARATTAPALEAALYADRPGAQRLLGESKCLHRRCWRPASRSTKRRRSCCAQPRSWPRSRRLTPRSTGALFRTLKFLRLLPVINRAAESGRLPGRDGRAAQPVSRRRPVRPLAGARRCRRSPAVTAGRSTPTCAGARSARR